MKSRLVMLLASTLVVASLISPVLGRSLSARADCYDCWTAIPSPNPGEGTDNHLHAVGAISDTDAWAVGNIGAFYTKFPIAMHWDGTDWNQNSPATWGQSDNELYGVAMIGSDNVLAVGDYTDESSSVVQTLTFLWDGEAWQHISSPNVGSGDNYLYAVAPNMPLKAW